MNATTMTLAKFAAIKAVKREIQARGLRVSSVAQRVIVAAARDYLRDHPELIEEAAETVRKVPQLRTLAEREERQRRRNQR
jgi:Copper resistance protein ScsC N-terminal domain